MLVNPAPARIINIILRFFLDLPELDFYYLPDKKYDEKYCNCGGYIP